MDTILLWSQIKLTSYDFSGLHITGEFDNRLGTGRVLKFSFLFGLPFTASQYCFGKVFPV